MWPCVLSPKVALGECLEKNVKAEQVGLLILQAHFHTRHCEMILRMWGEHAPG